MINNQKLDNSELEALYTEAVKNSITVTSLAQAKQVIIEATKPTCVVFPSLTLGAEDQAELSALFEEGLIKNVVIVYDEADFIQTKEQRVHSTTAVLRDGRKGN